jgi:hypothetical protein
VWRWGILVAQYKEKLMKIRRVLFLLLALSSPPALGGGVKFLDHLISMPVADSPHL